MMDSTADATGQHVNEAQGSLPHDSYVRPEKLYTGNQTGVLSRAGHATDDVQEKIHGRLLVLFQALDHWSRDMTHVPHISKTKF